MTSTVALERADDAAGLRRVFGAVPSSVVVLGGKVDDRLVGLAASTYIPVSLEPPLVAFSVQHTSTTWPILRTLPSVGLSVLGADHAALARQLAGPGERFAGLDVMTTPDGAVLLVEAIAHLECSVTEEVVAGDHAVVVLEVHRMSARVDAEPLVFHRSGFRRLADAAQP